MFYFGTFMFFHLLCILSSHNVSISQMSVWTGLLLPTYYHILQSHSDIATEGGEPKPKVKATIVYRESLPLPPPGYATDSM